MASAKPKQAKDLGWRHCFDGSRRTLTDELIDQGLGRGEPSVITEPLIGLTVLRAIEARSFAAASDTFLPTPLSGRIRVPVEEAAE